MDFCSGAYYKPKASMLLDQHRTFLRCDVDYELLTAAEADFLLTL